jgi:hypothetical protein
MKIIKNKNAERVIKAIIPQNILDLKPIIAGGFIVALYHNMIRYSSPVFDGDMSRKLDVTLSFQGKHMENYLIQRDLSKLLGNRFGDIDLWFSEDNPIWEDYLPKHLLVKDYYPDEILKAPPIGEHDWNQEYKEPDPKKRSFYMASRDLTKRSLQKDYELDANLKNSTYWANSFVLRETGYDLQFIKKPFSGPKELFENFDIVNCCAAYYDGAFCFHDDLERLYSDGILMTELDFEEMSVLRKIWIATRAFKYRERYAIEPDARFCDGIFKTYMEAVDLQTKIDKGEFKGDTIELDRYGNEDPYGRTAAPIKKVAFMLRNLFSKFEEFTKFQHYQDVYTVYFVTTEIEEIKSVVKKVMYPNEKESDKEKETDFFDFAF